MQLSNNQPSIKQGDFKQKNPYPRRFQRFSRINSVQALESKLCDLSGNVLLSVFDIGEFLV